jgi:hypothetical protein
MPVQRSGSSADAGSFNGRGGIADQASFALLGLVIVASPLALGSVHVIPLSLIAVLVAAATALALRLRANLPRGTPAVVAATLAACTLLQAMPLPISWLAALAPANADIWSRALLPLAEIPRWATVSLDPGASCVEALKWAIYACVFICAARLASTKGAPWVAVLVFGGAVAVAAATIGHGLAGATKVWGFYQPSFSPARWHVGPLLNPNNLAGYLNLGAFAGFGLVLTRKPVLPKWLVALGTSLIVATDVASASRGGVFALPLGLLVLGALAHRRRADKTPFSARALLRSREGRTLALAAGAICGGVALALLGGDKSLWDELYDTNVDKLSMLSWVRPVVRDFPWVGIGRGAFESVFPAYRANPANHVYTHAENILAQWAVEWGIPLTLLAILGFVATLRPWRMRLRERSVAAAAFVGVLVLLLQNFVDLGLEIPAVSIAFSALLGALWADGVGGGHRSATARRASPSRRVVVPAALVIVAGLALIRGRESVVDDRDRLHDDFAALDIKRAAEVASLRDEIRTMILRHPAEPYFPLVYATVAWLVHDQDPLPWLQRTLERSQTNGRAHLLLAEVLAGRRATSQELLELRLAVADDAALADAAADLALRATHDAERLSEVISKGPAGLPILDALARRCVRPDDHELRVSFDKQMLDRDPTSPGPHARLGADLVERAKNGEGCPAGSSCDRDFEAHLSMVQSGRPGASTPTTLRASMLAARGHPDGAVDLLARECPTFEDRTACLLVRAKIASEISDSGPLSVATRDLFAAGCSDPHACAEIASFAANLRAQRGEWATSAALFARAAREDPTERRFRDLGEIASKAGLHAEAADAFAHALERHANGDGELARRVEQERALSRAPLLTP